MRSSSVVFALSAAALASGAAVLAQNRGATPRTMSVDELRPGMTGYGLTVFHGTEPERFNVEIVDVLHNARPGMDMILIRSSHPILEHAATVAGMSGSPIYIDGRLIGAYAYGWEFGRDPVAGVTPIANMLPEFRIPHRTPPGLIPGSQVPLPIAALDHASAPHRDGWSLLAERMQASRAPIETPHGALVPVSVPLMVSGMADRAFRAFADSLAPLGIEALQGGGNAQWRSSAPPAAHFQPGGSISVPLVSGDLSAAGNGTVTVTDGDALIAFGHPMMGLGETSLPTAFARVVWVNPSLRHSQKMSEVIAPFGVLEEDRPFGIVCNERGSAPTVPMHVHVTGGSGATRSDWNVRLAYHRSLLPRLYSSVVSSVIETAASEAADAAWVVRSDVVTRDHGTLQFTDLGTSSEGTTGFEVSGLSTTEAVERLTDNPFEQVRIDRIDVNVELHWSRDFYYVRSVALSRAEVEPGQRVNLVVTLGQYGGGAIVRTIPLDAPREVAGRDVEIEVAGGFDTMDELPEPENVDDLIRNLTTVFPDEAIVVSMRMPGQGVMLHGRVVRDLPASAFDVLRPAASTESGEPFLNVRRTVVPIGRLIVGRDRVRLHVRDIRQ